MTRWLAIITYRTDAGSVDVPHDIEELSELQALVEQGPSWETIIRINVTLMRVHNHGLTVEKARTM